MQPNSVTAALTATEADNRGFILFITIVATLGGFLFGYDSGVINGTVDGLQQAFNSQSAGTGFNVASMLLGCAVGAFFAGRLADVSGRRTLLQVAAVFFVISAWGSGVADSSLEFVFYRILGGLAVGAASVMALASTMTLRRCATQSEHILASYSAISGVNTPSGKLISSYCDLVLCLINI